MGGFTVLLLRVTAVPALTVLPREVASEREAELGVFFLEGEGWVFVIFLFLTPAPKKLRGEAAIFLLPGGRPGFRLVAAAGGTDKGIIGSSSSSRIGPRRIIAGTRGGV